MTFNDKFEQVSLDCITILPSIRIGHTEYLDSISSEEMVDEKGSPRSIMKGMDAFGREFIVMKLQLLDRYDTILDAGIHTMFRRYSEGGLFVFCGSHYSAGGHLIAMAIGANTAIHTEHWEIFKTLIEKPGDRIRLHCNTTDVCADTYEVYLQLLPENTCESSIRKTSFHDTRNCVQDLKDGRKVEPTTHHCPTKRPFFTLSRPPPINPLGC